MTEPSFVQLVTQVLVGASRPLTVAEIKARVEMVRPVRTDNPEATIRGAITSIPLAASLGGRPAHYTWWPRHLADNTFRQPLAASNLEAGSLVVNKEVWLALWPDFYAGSSRSSGQVRLELADGPLLQGRIEHLVEGQAIWGLPATPALSDWYRRQGAAPDDDLIVRVLDVDERRYAVSLARRAERDEAALATRNQALAGTAEQVLRAARLDLPEFYLIPRLIARNVYRHPLPPDPWDQILRADLRFVLGEHDSVSLAEKMVDDWERECAVPPDPYASPRPRGDRRRARSEAARQAWGTYLFDRGMSRRCLGAPGQPAL
jgi:hypothetical protein